MPRSLADYSFPPGFERWITAKAELAATPGTIRNYDFVEFNAGKCNVADTDDVLTVGYAVALEAAAGKTHISVMLPGGPIYAECNGAIQPGGRFKILNTTSGNTNTHGTVIVAASASEVAAGMSPGYVMRHADDPNNLDAFADGDIAICMTEGA